MKKHHLLAGIVAMLLLTQGALGNALTPMQLTFKEILTAPRFPDDLRVLTVLSHGLNMGDLFSPEGKSIAEVVSTMRANLNALVAIPGEERPGVNPERLEKGFSILESAIEADAELAALRWSVLSTHDLQFTRTNGKKEAAPRFERFYEALTYLDVRAKLKFPFLWLDVGAGGACQPDAETGERTEVLTLLSGAEPSGDFLQHASQYTYYDLYTIEMPDVPEIVVDAVQAALKKGILRSDGDLSGILCCHRTTKTCVAVLDLGCTTGAQGKCTLGSFYCP